MADEQVLFKTLFLTIIADGTYFCTMWISTSFYILLNWHLLVQNQQWKHQSNMCEICSQLTIKTPERCQWRQTDVFIANFGLVSQIVLVFPSLVSKCWLEIYRVVNQLFWLFKNEIKPFHATDLFWYPLKTSENLWFTGVFRDYQKRSVTWNGLKSEINSFDLHYSPG